VKHIRALLPTEEHADAAVALAESLRPHFAGKHSAIVGAALADHLLGTWLARHPREVREQPCTACAGSRCSAPK
jgi:hypothetical protein